MLLWRRQKARMHKLGEAELCLLWNDKEPGPEVLLPS